MISIRFFLFVSNFINVVNWKSIRNSVVGNIIC